MIIYLKIKYKIFYQDFFIKLNKLFNLKKEYNVNSYIMHEIVIYCLDKNGYFM